MNSEPTPTPLRPDDPRTLGPFAVQARQRVISAAIVYLGTDETGRQVSIAQLTPWIAGDPDVRGRFSAAVARARQSPDGGRVVGAGLDAARPWVASPHGGTSDPAHQIVDEVFPVGYAPALHQATPQAPAGGETRPEPLGAAAGAPPPQGPDQRKEDTPWWMGAALFTALVGVVVALVVLVFSDDDSDLVTPSAAIGPTETPTTGAPEPPDPGRVPTRSPPGREPPPDPGSPPGAEPDPPGRSSPSASSEPEAGPGPVAGPSYGEDEPTYPMELDGMGFGFRTPPTWGCLRAKADVPGEVAWYCVDEANPDNGSGWIVVRDCPSPCGSSEQDRLHRTIDEVIALPPYRTWSRTDPTTLYAEHTGRRDDGPRVWVAMDHFWRRDGAKELNAQVFAQFTGPPEQKPVFQKMINDIRANTP